MAVFEVPLICPETVLFPEMRLPINATFQAAHTRTG